MHNDAMMHNDVMMMHNDAMMMHNDAMMMHNDVMINNDIMRNCNISLYSKRSILYR